MTNFLKRCFTSFSLLIVLYVSLINKLILFLLLVIISFVSLTEMFKMLKKIYARNKFKISIYLFISISYLSFFFSQLYFLINKDYQNNVIIIFLLSICVATDIGGYIFGKLFKGRKLTKISPNKTYSGLIGAYVLSISVFIFFYIQFNLSTHFIILTIIVSTVSQIGDLFISYLKRKAKIKNSGNFLPGHGGILDRIDGIIFALPLGINLTFIFG